MTPEVVTAIEEIKKAFPDHRVEVEPETQGGAYVVVHDLWIGDQYTPSTSWVGFLIDFQYSRSDVYPHFIDGAVMRKDEKPYGDGISGPMSWRNRQALQISRRSNHWDPTRDTATLKLMKVLEWIRSR